MTLEVNAAINRFVGLVRTTDVWSHDLTEAYGSLCEVLGVVPNPRAKSYAAAQRIAAGLEKARQARDAEMQRINLEFLDAIERAKGD